MCTNDYYQQRTFMITSVRRVQSTIIGPAMSQNGDPQFVGSIGMVLVELQYPAKGIQNSIDFNSLLAYLQKVSLMFWCT